MMAPERLRLVRRVISESDLREKSLTHNRVDLATMFEVTPFDIEALQEFYDIHVSHKRGATRKAEAPDLDTLIERAWVLLEPRFRALITEIIG